MKKWMTLLLTLVVAFLPVQTSVAAPLEKVEFILDWVPNTNHTGLYVAQAKGYFAEVGIELDVKRPPEGSTTELIGLGKAPFGISFQDSLANRFAGGLPVTAVAAIIEHNTSGVISAKEAGITEPALMADRSYGTWNDPIELAMLQAIVPEFDKVKLVPNQADNSVVGLVTKQFDSAWVYYAWDGIMAEHQQVATHYFNLRDYSDALDFYSPVIIANNDYLAKNAEQAKKILSAIKKGYQYAMEHPEEAADILIEAAPELKDQRDFVVASQKWLSEHYASDASKWGHIEEGRWNAFYQWLFEQKLIEKDLTKEVLFSNDYLE